MSTSDYVEINIPEAKEVADLSGIEMDLFTAKRFALQLKEIFEKSPPDFTHVDSLSIAILVQYSRPFTTGRRNKLSPEIIGKLTKKQTSLHEQYRDWRDKHIAHSVNPFEENKAVARYRIERFDEQGFTSIDSIGHRIVGLAYQDVLQIIGLIDALSLLINEEMNIKKNILLKIIQSLPKEQVLAMGKASPTPSQEGDVKRTRKH